VDVDGSVADELLAPPGSELVVEDEGRTGEAFAIEVRDGGKSLKVRVG
jgi:hypothetical protein